MALVAPTSVVPVQAVLFDYGIVLSGPPDPAAWARMLEITALRETAFRAAYWAPRHDYDRGLHTGAAYWIAAGQHAGLALTQTQIAALIEADNALWTGSNKPMIDWALRLQAARIPTGVLSNLGDEMTAGVLARHAWLAGFDHCVWSHTLRLAKPQLAIYQYAGEMLNTPPENILFIDDRQDNVDGARAAGMQAILYRDQSGFEAELSARGLDTLWHPTIAR